MEITAFEAIYDDDEQAFQLQIMIDHIDIRQIAHILNYIEKYALEQNGIENE